MDRTMTELESVYIRYLYFDNVKLVTFTKQESSTDKKGYYNIKIDTGSNSNLMPFKVFRILYPQ